MLEHAPAVGHHAHLRRQAGGGKELVCDFLTLLPCLCCVHALVSLFLFSHCMLTVPWPAPAFRNTDYRGRCSLCALFFLSLLLFCPRKTHSALRYSLRPYRLWIASTQQEPDMDMVRSMVEQAKGGRFFSFTLLLCSFFWLLFCTAPCCCFFILLSLSCAPSAGP